MFYTPRDNKIRATQYVIIYRSNKPVSTMIFRNMDAYLVWQSRVNVDSRSVSLQLYNLVSSDLWAKMEKDWSKVPLIN